MYGYSCSFDFLNVWPNRYIKRNQLEEGHDILVGERLSYPGFVEFDPVNGNILTFSAEKRYVPIPTLANTWYVSFDLCIQGV